MSPDKYIVSLPPELERTILETAVLSNRRSVFKLILIAQRTRIWLEPLLYTSVNLHPRKVKMEKFLHVLDTKPPEFFARHVKSISFGNQATRGEMERILSVCTGVVELCSSSKNPIHLTSSVALSELIRPRRMSLEIGTLLGLPDRPTHLAHPIFSQVTHLELDDDIEVWSTFAFELLPCLTHLGVSTRGVHEWDARRLESVRRILFGCRLLKVLWVEVIMEWPCFDESPLRTVLDDVGNDPRVVIFSSDYDEEFVRLSGFVVAEKTATKQALLDGRTLMV